MAAFFLLSSALSLVFSRLLVFFLGENVSMICSSVVSVAVLLIFELLLAFLVLLTFLDTSLESCDQLGLVEPVF